MGNNSKQHSGPGRILTSVVPLLLVTLASAIQLWSASPPEVLLYQLSNDSTMRLVTLNDLMAGQGWWDLHQYRLGPTGGFEMHWSRLVDAPMVALFWLFDQSGMPGGGRYWLVVVWPLVWFAIGVFCIWRIGLALGGAVAGIFASLLATSSLMSNMIFRPGSIDHHNVQIGLLLIAVLGLVRRHASPAMAGMSGAAVAISLGVGVETMPHLALVAVGVALFWACRGADEAAPMAWFSAALGVTMAIVMLGFAPRSALVGGYCDAVSVDLAVPVGLGAALLWAITRLLPRAQIIQRFAVLGGAGLLVGLTALFLFPACLSNPLDGLAPVLQRRWLALVAEAQGLGAVLDGRAPRLFLAYYLFGAASGLIAVGLAFRRSEQRETWLLLAGLIFVSLGFSIYQLRGTVMLATIGVVPVAVAAADLRAAARQMGRPVIGVAAIALLVASVPSLWAFVPGILHTDRADANAAPLMGDTPLAINSAGCVTPASMGRLAALPAGLVSANSNLGAQILLHSPHRVLSAPYHRNQAGMLAQLDIALAPDAASAEKAMRKAGVTYVVSCSEDPELGALRGAGYSGFGWQLQSGVVPDFLQPVPPETDTALRVYMLRD